MAIVSLFDINETTVAEWARNNCPSFEGWFVYENDILFLDDDPEWCTRYEFEFADDQEALMFQLRWQGQ